MYYLCLLCDCLIAASDGREQRVCSALGEVVLDSTGLHGMPVHYNNHTAKSQYSFSVVYNN